MKNIFTILAFLMTIHVNAQTTHTLTSECNLFANDFLQKLSANHYNNADYIAIKADRNKRKELLQALEEYLFVFRSTEISPMYLTSYIVRQPCPKLNAWFIKYKWYRRILSRKCPTETDVNKSCPIFIEEFTRLEKDSSHLNTNGIRELLQKPYKTDVWYLFLDLCGLLEEAESPFVAQYISEFKRSFTLGYIYNRYRTEFSEPCRLGTFDNHADTSLKCLSRFAYESNLRQISERIDQLDKLTYCYYESFHSKANMLKGFEAHHDNDVLVPGNQDREYTGGFKFNLATDYFKWRFFRFPSTPENVISYQSISVGGYGYTPYIRYRNNFQLADSIHRNDRPFGSYLYFERAKYRTWRKGVVRQKGEFQAGSIGISQGRKIQAQLHEDVIQESQFVYGWDKQIGNGGRLALQLNQKVDLLLFSTTNRFMTIFAPNKVVVRDKKKYAGLNLIGEVDLRIGGFYTSAGAGLRLSTLDFLKQSGTQQISVKRPGCKREFGWKLDIGVNYRYVQHNTMLEGLGYIETFPKDSYDKVNPDYYVLTKDQIQRHLLIIDWGVNFRFRKTTVYFRQTFHSLEYKSSLTGFDYQNKGLTGVIDPKDIDYYNSTVVKENKSFINQKWFGGQTYYGYGTLGISWIIE